MQSFRLIFRGYDFTGGGSNFPFSIDFFAWTLQQCSATALPVMGHLSHRCISPSMVHDQTPLFICVVCLLFEWRTAECNKIDNADETYSRSNVEMYGSPCDLHELDTELSLINTWTHCNTVQQEQKQKKTLLVSGVQITKLCNESHFRTSKFKILN